MLPPKVKTVKVYAIVESVLESRVDAKELHEFLRTQKFRGSVDTSVNFNEGGVTNIVTKQHIPLTMEEIDFLLSRRKA